VSISVTVWIMAMRYHRGLALALAAFVPAMAAGAVYGGFHYLLDIAAGAVLGIAAGVWGHRLTLQLSGEEAASAPAARSAAGSTVSGA
jgi:membrane-associated phospholipid phosphatase